MNSNRRTELAGFLRARRARLSPRQAGLPEAGTPNRRRTSGLRRQEVAQLAGLSVDYCGGEGRGPMLKHVGPPLAGLLELECRVLHIAETGHRLIAYCAAPGSATGA